MRIGNTLRGTLSKLKRARLTERRVHLISFRRTVVGLYDSITKFRPLTRLKNQYSVAFKIAMLSLNERSVKAQNFVVLLYNRMMVLRKKIKWSRPDEGRVCVEDVVDRIHYT